MGLPFIDEHRTVVAAPRAVVWSALRRYVASLGVDPRSPVGWLLGTQPRSGFEVVEEDPGRRVRLAGRHRFSRYVLEFCIEEAEADGQTELIARSYGEFPRLPGRVYRALVIGTRFHVLAMHNMLRTVRRASLTAPRSP